MVYVIAGYIFAFAAIATYTFWLFRRARKLAALVPEEKRSYLE